MKKIMGHFLRNWIWYVLGFVVIGVISWPIQKYINSHYTKDITCTVTSASTELRSGGSGGRASSSPTSIVQTEECGQLVFYSTFVEGVGMQDITNQLGEGKPYIFTVNRYVLFNNHPEVQGIKETNGAPVRFTSS